MKLILHIGTAKTGTSHIQGALAANRDALAKAGILYPGRQPSHVWLASHFHPEPETITLNAKRGRSVRADIRAATGAALADFEAQLAARPWHTVIVSSEFFNMLDEAALARLRAYFARFCDTIEVLCYARHPLSFTVSATQQFVKSGHKSLSQYYKQPPFTRFSRLLPRYVAAFGKENVKLRAYDKSAFAGGDILADFCAATGIPLEALQNRPDDRGNESLSLEAALLADALATAMPSFVDGGWNPARMRSNRPLTQVSGAPFSLPVKVLDTVARDSAPDLAYLAEEFGLHLPEPAPTDRQPPRWDATTIRDIALLINDQAVAIERLKALVRYQEGMAAFRHHDLDQALREFDAALRLDPGLAVAREQRAVAVASSRLWARVKRIARNVFIRRNEEDVVDLMRRATKNDL